MERICEGALVKAQVLATTIEQYKEVYVTVRRGFDTVIEVSLCFMHRRSDLILRRASMSI